jgi:hypothetical protein
VSGDIGIAPAGDGRFALAFINRDNRPRVVAGLRRLLKSSSQTDKWILVIDPDLFDQGLSCAENEACASQTPETFTPVLAALDNGRVLIAYVRGSVNERQKGCGALDTPQTVLANFTRIESGYLKETSEHAMALGTTKDIAPPLVVPIPRIAPEQEQLGWLAALSEENGDIRLKLVRESGNGASIEVIDLLSVPGDGESQGDLSLAFGPSTDNALTVGLAFRRGCAPNARVMAQLFSLEQDRDDFINISEKSQADTVSEDKSERATSITYLTQREIWVVVYTNGQGALKARLLDQRGAVRDKEAYTLFKPKTGDTGVLLAPFALMPAEPNDASWVNALANIKANGAYSFRLFGLGCQQFAEADR